ncbi:MAG TPA: hypothetical protein VFG19_08255 [Geobacteraceae bacterium]|nr:hypothetical protein [Geobacteraceae bacterium]
MSDMREALEMMREVARTRIDMLQNRVTLHDEPRRSYYLTEYREKLKKIEDIIRRMNIRLIRSDAKVLDDNPVE